MLKNHNSGSYLPAELQSVHLNGMKLENEKPAHEL